MYKILKIFVVVVSLSAVCLAMPVDIQLSARDVANGDLVWGPPDPQVHVKYAIGGNSPALVGKTATLHTNNPDWAEVFQFQYVDHLDQNLQFDVIENDAFFDDKYGTVNIKMVDLVNAPGKSLERDFGKGRLIIKKVN